MNSSTVAVSTAQVNGATPSVAYVHYEFVRVIWAAFVATFAPRPARPAYCIEYNDTSSQLYSTELAA